MKFFNIIFYLVLSLFTTSCSHMGASEKYKNTHERESRGLLDVISWRFKKLFSSENDKKLPLQETVNTVQLLSPKGNQITWIGHSTLLIQIGDINILTDPHFYNQASPVSWAGPERLTPSPFHPSQIPLEVDYIFISHNHYDHLDLPSLRHFANNKKTKIFVPSGLKKWFSDQNIHNTIELKWWERHSFGDSFVEAVPMQHDSGRGLWDQKKTHWAGWVFSQSDFQFIFLGDTGYSSDFQDIQKKFGSFDLAAIPIGGYKPRKLFKDVHVTPEEAVNIHNDLKSELSIGIHWGTFKLTDEAILEPQQRLEKAQSLLRPNTQFLTLNIGQTLKLIRKVQNLK